MKKKNGEIKDIPHDNTNISAKIKQGRETCSPWFVTRSTSFPLQGLLFFSFFFHYFHEILAPLIMPRFLFAIASRY